jgi:hypothetical protein
VPPRMTALIVVALLALPGVVSGQVEASRQSFDAGDDLTRFGIGSCAVTATSKVVRVHLLDERGTTLGTLEAPTAGAVRDVPYVVEWNWDGVTIKAVWNLVQGRTEFFKDKVPSGVSDGNRIDYELAELMRQQGRLFAIHNAVVEALEARKILKGVRPHWKFYSARETR